MVKQDLPERWIVLPAKGSRKRSAVYRYALSKQQRAKEPTPQRC